MNETIREYLIRLIDILIHPNELRYLLLTRDQIVARLTLKLIKEISRLSHTFTRQDMQEELIYNVKDISINYA